MLIKTDASFFITINEEELFRGWEPVESKFLEGFNGNGSQISFSERKHFMLGLRSLGLKFRMMLLAVNAILGINALCKLRIVIDLANREILMKKLKITEDLEIFEIPASRRQGNF